MFTLTSPDGKSTCQVVPECGGRIGSLRIADAEILVTGLPTDDPLSWGCYPMVPYAGRVRSGILFFNHVQHQLEVRVGPHALHGTVLDRPWNVLHEDSHCAVLDIDLGSAWPFAGTVRHEIHLQNDALQLLLTVTAHQLMPIQMGWHPWFFKPSRSHLNFSAMLARDEQGITTNQIAPPSSGLVDDCFIDPLETLTMTINGRLINLMSDCSHWVVYDLRDHATCVEPQSGAPNAINDDPFILGANESLTRSFEIQFPNLPEK